MALIADSGRLPPILVALIDVLIVNLAMILFFSPTSLCLFTSLMNYHDIMLIHLLSIKPCV